MQKESGCLKSEAVLRSEHLHAFINDAHWILLTRFYRTRRKQLVPPKWKIPKTHRSRFMYLFIYFGVNREN